MKGLILLIILITSDIVISTDPIYSDDRDAISDCFGGSKGWISISSQCLFPLTQFERNYSVAIQMCGAVNHSTGYRETNWLIALKLYEQLAGTEGLNRVYWTGLSIFNEELIGIETSLSTDKYISPYTSIYNPLWASDEPSRTISLLSSTNCIAIDMITRESFGWRILPCSTNLPIICQNYACKSGDFRCFDNSKCIPKQFVRDGFEDCFDGSDELSLDTPSTHSNSFQSDLFSLNNWYNQSQPMNSQIGLISIHDIPTDFTPFALLSDIDSIDTTPTPIGLAPSSPFNITPFTDTFKCFLPQLTNGYIINVTNNNNPLYHSGTIILYQCIVGYSTDLNSLLCQNGTWKGIIDVENEWIEITNIDDICRRIQCGQQTPIDKEMEIYRDEERDYGSIRKYEGYYEYLSTIVPFCVCGGNIQQPTEWQCWNYDKIREIDGGACVTPIANDIRVTTSPISNWYHNNQTISLSCYLCPSVIKLLKCSNGKWIDNHNKTIEYDGLKCDCEDSNQCGNGVYQSYPGTYICDCPTGYAFRNGTCNDIDECLEEISFCDKLSTCINTIGSFQCECPIGFQLYQNDNESFGQYQNNPYLIKGYSCINMLCSSYSINQIFHDNNIIVKNIPSETTYYRYKDTTGILYATNLCDQRDDTNCYIPFSYQCINGTLIPDRNIIGMCPDIPNEYQYTITSDKKVWRHIYSTVTLKCASDTQIMIGRKEVICNSTLQWDQLPICVYDTCSDISGYFKNPIRIDHIVSPPNDKNAPIFGIGTQVYFDCYDNYTLVDKDPLTCTQSANDSNPIWIGTLPICLKNNVKYGISVQVCQLDSCPNGRCIEEGDDGYTCECNDISSSISECIPDHCKYTNIDRTSGFDCKTGEYNDLILCENTRRFGSFCQFEGAILNSSYTYSFQWDTVPDYSLAINVCDDYSLSELFPDIPCQFLPSTSSHIDVCDECAYDAGHCERGTDKNPYCTPCGSKGDVSYYGYYCSVIELCLNSKMEYYCLNGGICNPSMGDYDIRCMCKEEWIGERCEIWNGTDSCDMEMNCGNGRCRKEVGVEYCNCDDNYIRDENGICTVERNMCHMNNPCQQNSICGYDIETGQISCDCSLTNGWTGQYCEQKPNNHSCDAYCDINNTKMCLSDFVDRIECECGNGYIGDTCDNKIINECEAFQPCFNNGKCTQLYDKDEYIEGYNCTCYHGYSGSNCQLYGVCDLKCENGGACEWNDIDEKAYCSCTDQFYGDSCKKSCYDVCIHSNGCHDYQNGTLTCQCINGFSSQYCDIVDDVCTANVLSCGQHGHCISYNQTCQCDDNYQGEFCQLDMNPCRNGSIVCLNNGTCNPLSFSCSCPFEYTGDRCDIPFIPCDNSLTCYNGGICMRVNNSTNQYCDCPDGVTGSTCDVFGQPCDNYCDNNAQCTVTPAGAVCDCDGTDYIGVKCETKLSYNYNLIFNGLSLSYLIKSTIITVKDFTICSFVQYNFNDYTNDNYPYLAPYSSIRLANQSIIFDNYGFGLCYNSTYCDNNRSNVIVTPNTWHHVCVISTSDTNRNRFTMYLDGVLSTTINYQPFDMDMFYIQLVPNDLIPEGSSLFEGTVSMTQLYSKQLSEAEIGRLAFDCNREAKTERNGDNSYELKLKWEDGYPRVKSSDPAVFVDPAGICDSVKCMFGRQTNGNNWNATGECKKDTIPPTVYRCPSSIIVPRIEDNQQDYISVEWKDEEIAFFDNIGVVNIENNYHNGQQFGIGITKVQYIASDAAGNIAICEFEVIITRRECPSDVQVLNGQVYYNGSTGDHYSPGIATVNCNDPNYPYQNEPRFYTCDMMGSFRNNGLYINGTYYLPSCGNTVSGHQTINGTVVGSGTCEEEYDKLSKVLWNTVECGTAMCIMTIRPNCTQQREKDRRMNDVNDKSDNIALQYIFTTKNTYETIQTNALSRLRENFKLVRQDSTLECNDKYPITVIKDNSTYCVQCPAGTYADMKKNECIECEVNTYRNISSDNQLKCDDCPNGMITGTLTGSMDISHCYIKCDPGQYASTNTKCDKCPIGSYSDIEGLINKCTSCSYDSSTQSDESKSINDCNVYCDPGQQMIRKDGQKPECVSCDIGYYKESTTGPCIQCPRGLTTNGKESTRKAECNQLNCIDMNTMKNNISISNSNGELYELAYSELCITCEQGKFQNTSNADFCYECDQLDTDITDIPMTCQSTCSADVPTPGCDCQLQKNNLTRNCLPTVTPASSHGNAIVIVLPIVFGVLIFIIIIVACFFRRQIYDWFMKRERNDDQRARPIRLEETDMVTDIDNIPSNPSSTSIYDNTKPDVLRIITNRKELDDLPPLPDVLSFVSTQNTDMTVSKRKKTDMSDDSVDSFF